MTVSALAAAGVGALAARRAAARRDRAMSRAIAVYPAVAIVAFAVFSRVVVGAWFVASDFFVPENKALGDPIDGGRARSAGARAC